MIRYGHIYDPIASGAVSIVLSFSMSDDADKQQRFLEKGCKHVWISESYIKVGAEGQLKAYYPDHSSIRHALNCYINMKKNFGVVWWWSLISKATLNAS